MANCEEEFLIEYFKEMRAEILLQIGDHKKLVTTKVISCGALLGFLLTEDLKVPFNTWGFVLIPIISMLYDVMIAKNVRCIHRIAYWIRLNVETKLSTDYHKLWENYSGQKDMETRNYGRTDILFLSIFTAATILVPVVLLYSPEVNHWKYVCIVLAILQVIVIFLMKKWFLWFGEDENNSNGKES